LIKVLIADDDKIIRKGLRAIIEESAPYCRIIGEAFNGKQALEMIRTEDPDLLITDIKMPLMDGVELVKTINDMGIDTRSIILSGFNEYKYVRETMKSGAIDYLLKPIEDEVLLDLLNKTYESIRFERQRKQQSSMLSERMAESMPILKEKLLQDLIKGTYKNTSDYAHILDETGILQSRIFLLVIMEIDDYYRISNDFSRKDNKSFIDVFKQYVLEKLESSGYSNSLMMTENDARLNILFYSQFTDKDFYNDVIYLLEQIKGSELLIINDFTVTCGISKLHDDLERIHIAYYQAFFALNRRFYEGKNRIISYIPEDSLYNEFYEKQLQNEIGNLLGFVEIGEPLKAKNTIYSIMDTMNKNNVEPDQFRDIITNIVRNVSFASQEYKDILESYAYEYTDFFLVLKEANTLTELTEYVATAFYSILTKMNQVRAERSKKIIEIAKEFIKKHYNEGINQKTVAEHVYLSPNYFSELFKNATGKTFTKYLIEARIDAAKKLLAKPEVKVYEVGQIVGYDEPVSFSRVFKKIVGVSPAGYRKITN
jgi:two-component system response regulator YesN